MCLYIVSLSTVEHTVSMEILLYICTLFYMSTHMLTRLQSDIYVYCVYCKSCIQCVNTTVYKCTILLCVTGKLGFIKNRKKWGANVQIF